MTEAKLFQVVYFVLLSLLACSFNNIEHAAAEDKSDNNAGSGEDGGGKWLWGARGLPAGLFPAMGGGIGGSIDSSGISGSISGSIPGLGIGGSVGGGISGGAIPGIGIGGIEGFGDIGWGVGVTGSGTDKVNYGHSTGNGVGSGEGIGIGGGYGGTGNGGGSGSGVGSGFDVGGGIGGDGIGYGSGGGWVMAPEWLGQPLCCTPMRCPGGGGIELHLGRFISSNLSGNSHDDDGSGIPSNGTDGAGAGANNDDHQQTQDQVSSAEAPMSG